MGSNVTEAQVRETRQCLEHFICGLLEPNPKKRWTPDQAKHHPFITNAPFTPDWAPPPPNTRPP